MMPYMLIVILCMVIMYLWPRMTLWLPNYLYGGLRRSGGAPDACHTERLGCGSLKPALMIWSEVFPTIMRT